MKARYLPLLIYPFLLGCNYQREKGARLDRNDDLNPQSAETKSSTDRASFAWISANVLVPHCVRCHRPDKASGDFDASSFEAVKGGDAVVERDPENSDLWLDVAWSPDAKNKMPRRAPKLSDEKIQAIYDWIKNGANKN